MLPVVLALGDGAGLGILKLFLPGRLTRWFPWDWFLSRRWRAGKVCTRVVEQRAQGLGEGGSGQPDVRADVGFKWQGRSLDSAAAREPH